MLHKVTADEIASKLQAEQPSWRRAYVDKIAQECIEHLNPVLEENIAIYVHNGEMKHFSYGEFDLETICAFNRSRGYMEALILMNIYMNDADSGKHKIIFGR